MRKPKEEVPSFFAKAGMQKRKVIFAREALQFKNKRGKTSVWVFSLYGIQIDFIYFI